MARQLPALPSDASVNVSALQSMYRLTDETCARLRLLTDEFFQSRTRIQVELTFMTVQLEHMRALLGEHFNHYATQTLGLSMATVRRYQGAYRALVRLYPDGQIDMRKVNGLSISSLNLLMRHDSDDIIEAVRGAIESNQALSVEDIRTLIAERETQASDELVSIKMELEAALKQAEASRQAYEHQIVYLNSELASTTARAKNATAELQEANDEILRLCTQEPVTVEKVVQVLPEGFLNAHQAVVATEASLKRLESSKTEVEARIASLTEQLATLSATVEREHDAATQVDALENHLGHMERLLDAIGSDQGKKGALSRLPGLAGRLAQLSKRLQGLVV